MQSQFLHQFQTVLPPDGFRIEPLNDVRGKQRRFKDHGPSSFKIKTVPPVQGREHLLYGAPSDFRKGPSD